jgi:hypothetical protein
MDGKPVSLKARAIVIQFDPEKMLWTVEAYLEGKFLGEGSGQSSTEVFDLGLEFLWDK